MLALVQRRDVLAAVLLMTIGLTRGYVLPLSAAVFVRLGLDPRPAARRFDPFSAQVERRSPLPARVALAIAAIIAPVAWLAIAAYVTGRPDEAALAYASDLTLLGVTTVPHNVFIGLNVHVASIDHAMWFHRPFRADEWLLYDQISPSASSGLGLATARLFQYSMLVSSVAQEGLIRPLRKP